MTERRYDEDEVREIFDLATSGRIPTPAQRRAEGLTLSDIQSIGREVGMEEALIARAAAALDARPARRLRKAWGQPVEVGRVVDLPRAPTDHEWAQLVAELRSTFGARGRLAAHGGLREWANGNLHATIEPTENGCRLRLGTVKGDAMPMNAFGAIGVAAGAFGFASLALSGGAADVGVPIMLAAAGVSALVANALRLPRWARERERQMDHIVAETLALLGTHPAHGPGS